MVQFLNCIVIRTMAVANQGLSKWGLTLIYTFQDVCPHPLSSPIAKNEKETKAMLYTIW